MKTYLKGIKTVAVIFLSLILFSCQDSLIEQQDYLLSETKQDLSKNKPIEYDGRFTEGEMSGPNLLVSLLDGDSSSLKFTIQWQPGCIFSDICDDVFNLEVYGVESLKYYYPKYNVQISLFKKAGKIYGFQMWLHDGDYQFTTDKTSLNPVIDFPEAEPTVVIEINQEVELFRHDNGSGKKHRESVGMIKIGNLEYSLK